MKCISMLILVLLLVNRAVQYAKCKTIYIIPTPDSPCPSATIGQPCFTLEQYVADPSHSANITLLLCPGNHSMDRDPLGISDINSFTMRATKPASVTVMCGQPPQHDYWFSIGGVPTVLISDITFNGCQIANGGHLGNNLTIDQCIFKSSGTDDKTTKIYHYYSGNLNILNSNFSNNEIPNNLIFIKGESDSTIIISNCHFNGNVANDLGGAIFAMLQVVISITNSSFINNKVTSSSGLGGAIYTIDANITITNSIFIDNSAGSTNGFGGAVFVRGGNANVSSSYFSNNRAGGCGGAITINDTNNVLVSNTTFTNNTASSGGGGAIYTGGTQMSYKGASLVNISLLNNTFSNSTSAYCGVLDVDEPLGYRSNAKIVGNTFTYNRAVGQVAGNNGGGVICVRNASVSVLENQFSHNVAAGDAGVLLVNYESDITISKCTFDNNTAGSNGGVLYTYLYPSHYTISSSSFTNNQAGGDGGVIFVGRASSQVKITKSIFSYNSATGRGGAIAIAGSTLHINKASLCAKNTAKLGRVISACKSKVVITNPKIPSAPDPIYSFCTLFDCSNSTYTFSKP